MEGRALRILLVAWAVWWFTWFVPAHQRGAIEVPGAEAGASSGCCAPPAAAEAEPHCPPPDERDPVRRCAVCDLVTKLDGPPEVVFTAPPLGPAGMHWPTVRAQPRACAPIPVYLSRGPPRSV